jgi:hypothetical protein
MEICLSKGSRFSKGPYVRHCPKAMPPFIPHNFELTPPGEVIISILELGRSELPLAHHFNPMAPSLYG